MRQSTLPADLDAANFTLARLEPGKTVYIVPWAIEHLDGQPLVRATFDYATRPGGTTVVRVHRRTTGTFLIKESSLPGDTTIKRAAFSHDQYLPALFVDVLPDEVELELKSPVYYILPRAVSAEPSSQLLWLDLGIDYRNGPGGTSHVQFRVVKVKGGDEFAQVLITSFGNQKVRTGPIPTHYLPVVLVDSFED